MREQLESSGMTEEAEVMKKKEDGLRSELKKMSS